MNAPDPNLPRRRLRFRDFALEAFPDGLCRAQVDLEWTEETVFVGRAEGTHTREGKARAGAEATLDAARSATKGKVTLSLAGVKVIRVFDGWIVVAAVREEREGEARSLVGAYPCPSDDTPRGAALAVLNSINRLLEPHLVDQG